MFAPACSRAVQRATLAMALLGHICEGDSWELPIWISLGDTSRGG